jgi:microsomal dipeptidase-like Zn-dependent dipeptidase
VGRARVNHVQSNNNYFEDVEREYKFFEYLNECPIKTTSGTYQYALVKSYRDIQSRLDTGSASDNIIFIVMTIEGMHVLNDNVNGPVNEASFLANLRKIKSWRCPPFFVTFAHHFYNHLCGHAKSLTGIVGKETDQSEKIDTGFTDLGILVLNEVLSDQNGRRILIDIKHMSAQSRKEYFYILETAYAGQDIPVIVSHGAASGLRSMDERVVDHPSIGNKLLQEDINFYDNEIVAVAKSNGIFGLQLDERRIANAQTLRSVKHSIFMNKIRHYRAELLWDQIQYIAELLDHNDLPAWDCIALGTDFEGIINPINGYLTAESIVHLESFVERYAFNYMNADGKKLKSYNQLPASDIINKIFQLNGMDFIKRYF